MYTLRVRNRPTMQKRRSGTVGPFKTAKKLHYVEPQFLPSETYCPRKKIYTKVTASGSQCGIPTVDLGSLYVARVSKSLYDSVNYIQLLSRNVYSQSELRIAKRWFHTFRRWYLSKIGILGTSRFLRRAVRVLSITLRLSERHLRCRESCSAG